MHTHVIHSNNQHKYIDVLDKLFSIRHDIYVREKQWREQSDDGFEIDQYDTDRATYLVCLDGDEIVAGSRLIPFTEPTMLAEHFSFLCDEQTPVPVQPDIAEWTRGFVAPKYREKRIGSIKSRFCADVMEYCIQENIRLIGGIQEVYWLRMWQKMGWPTHVLGPTLRIAGRRCVAAFNEVSIAARDQALSNADCLTHSLVHEGPYRPFVQMPGSSVRAA